MNRHALDANRRAGAVLLVHLDSLHPGERREAVVANDAAKDGVEPVEVRRLVEEEEELRAVGSRPLVGHAHDAAVSVPQRRADLVVEAADSPDGAATLGVVGGVGPRGRAGLGHELGDEPVKGRIVVVAGRAEGEKVLFWGCGCKTSVDGEAVGECVCGRERVRTSAVLGTLSQNTSILRSPRDVCSVTDIAPAQLRVGEAVVGDELCRAEAKSFEGTVKPPVKPPGYECSGCRAADFHCTALEPGTYPRSLRQGKERRQREHQSKAKDELLFFF